MGPIQNQPSTKQFNQLSNHVTFNSLSSSLIFGVSLIRNQQPSIANKCAGQFGYALTALVALVEYAVSSVFTALTVLIYPISSTPFEFAIRWLGSSQFVLIWSLFDFIFNPFADNLIADELSARSTATSRQLFTLPHAAYI